MIDAMQETLKDPATLNAVGFIAGSLAGIPLNWIVRWARNEVGCIFDMFRTQVRSTVLSIMSNLSIVFTAVATGTVPDKFIVAVIAGVVLTGFVDSALNKGKRKEWTDEERTMNEVKKP